MGFEGFLAPRMRLRSASRALPFSMAFGDGLGAAAGEGGVATTGAGADFFAGTFKAGAFFSAAALAGPGFFGDGFGEGRFADEVADGFLDGAGFREEDADFGADFL